MRVVSGILALQAGGRGFIVSPAPLLATCLLVSRRVTDLCLYINPDTPIPSLLLPLIRSPSSIALPISFLHSIQYIHSLQLLTTVAIVPASLLVA